MKKIIIKFNFRKARVPVLWRCKHLGCWINVSKVAVALNKGFICDCGSWVYHDNFYHDNVDFATRECCFRIEKKVGD